MPYIEQHDRERAATAPRTPGELNYAITLCLIAAWNDEANHLALHVVTTKIITLAEYYWSKKTQNYTTINDILGAIAGAIMEFRRRSGTQSFGRQEMIRIMIAKSVSKAVDYLYEKIAVPYEIQKIEENGDVYG